MKIILINGSMPHYDHGLGRVLSVIGNTLAELGMQIEDINLGYSQLHYFDGMQAKAMDDISARIMASGGVIFACTTQLYAPCSMIKTFLEFLECPDYKDILREKHCLAVTVSKDGGEKGTLDYFSKVIGHFSAYEGGRIGLLEAHTVNMENGPEAVPGSVRDIIEKISEDFYRLVRQNRKFITPSEGIMTSAYTPPAYQQAQPPVYQQQAPEIPYQEPPQRPAEVVARKLNLDAFTERQEEDIKELTALFSRKYESSDDIQAVNQNPYKYQQNISQNQARGGGYQPPLTNEYRQEAPKPIVTQAPPARVKTVKQLTQSLPHYYQPQMASGLTAVIQLNITGDEPFEGYLNIVDSECDYRDGYAENPEITIISDSKVWQDVLKGKHTAQKAFMIGGLKVRGNFVLLTKFDTMFKL